MPGRWLNRELQQLSYTTQVVRPVGRPVVFQVELTNRCPMTCQMCPRTHSMNRPLGYMSRETFLRVLDEAERTTSALFLHHFGDSLIHPDLAFFLDEARRRGVSTHLSANPVLLTDDRVRAVVDNGLHELVLSLDGVTPKTSEAVRGPAARNVALAERRIRDLVAYRASVAARDPRIILQIVQQAQNVHEVGQWLDRWRAEPGIDRVKVKSYTTWIGGIEAIDNLRLAPPVSKAGLVCEKPWTSVTVLWDGRVVPCCFDYDGLLTVGTLREHTLAEIWRGDPLRRLRSRHRDGDLGDLALCRNCVDKEGYPVRRWYYPLNRLRQAVMPLGAEVDISRPSTQPGVDPSDTTSVSST